MPVAIDHLKVHPKHKVIKYIIPQVTNQLIPYKIATVTTVNNNTFS